ncbi:MAG: replication initiator protein A, partial [Fusobacteriaceae bacterium]
MGVTMLSTLIAKNVSDKVFQPSIFEEKIYTYLISMYEAQKEADDDSEYIDFEISDFIENFLGNKMNRTYYTKVEQSLKNLKNTEYQFIVSNHTKLGKFKFEDEEFKLLTYQKLKTGKKVYYRVILNKNIRRKIKEKRYVKYNSKPLVEIMNIDPIASRIYKYISFARMGEDTNRINIRTLAAIIPLKTEQITERIGKDGRTKEYILCRMKQVLARIIKAFEVLIKLGYIEYCQEERVKQENTYYLTYKFNKEKDWTCHISSYIENNSPNGRKKKLIKSNKEVNLKVQKNPEDPKEIKTITKANSLATEKVKVSKNEFSDIIYKKINKAKKNIYINKSWEKKVDGKIHRIYKEHGEEFTILVLENLSKLAGPVKTTLIQYLNGMLSNMLSDKNKKNNLQIFVLDDNAKMLNGKINITKTGRKRAEKNFLKIQTVDIPQEKTFSEKYESLDELEKLKIEGQALKLCCKETDISEKMLLKMKDQLPVAYKNALKDYIDKILEANFSDK